MLIQISEEFSVINSLEVKLNLTLQSSNKSLLEPKLKLPWVTDNQVCVFSRNFTSSCGRSSSFGKNNCSGFPGHLSSEIWGVTCVSGFPGCWTGAAFPVRLITSKACANPTNSMFVVDPTLRLSAGLTTSVWQRCRLHVSLQKGWTWAPQLTSVQETFHKRAAALGTGRQMLGLTALFPYLNSSLHPQKVLLHGTQVQQYVFPTIWTFLPIQLYYLYIVTSMVRLSCCPLPSIRIGAASK